MKHIKVIFLTFLVNVCSAMDNNQAAAIEKYKTDVTCTQALLINIPLSLHDDLQQLIMDQCIADRQIWYNKRLFDHHDWVYHASFSKDETRFIVAKNGGIDGCYACVHTIKTSKNDQKNISIPLRDTVNHASFYKNETHIITATGFSNHAIEIWDITGEPVSVGKLQHDKEITKFCLSQDQTLLATGCYDGTVYIWDPATETQTNNVKVGDTWIRALCFSPDKTLLAIAHDKEVYILDSKTLQTKASFEHTFVITSIFFNKEGTKLITTSYDCTVHIWDVDKKEGHRELLLSEGPIGNASFNTHETKLVVSAEGPKTRLIIWDYINKKILSRISIGCFDIGSVYFNKAETQLLVALSSNHEVGIWKRYNTYTFAQLWLLHALYTWCLVEKPNKKIKTSETLLNTVASTLRYNNEKITDAWATFIVPVQEIIFNRIRAIIECNGK